MTLKELSTKSLLSLNRNLAITVSLIIVFVLILLIIGCNSTVESIVTPGKNINRIELDTEIENFLNIAETRYKNLDQQDAFKRIVFENAMLYTRTGTINPLGVISALFGLLGAGAVTDNVRNRMKTHKKTN